MLHKDKYITTLVTQLLIGNCKFGYGKTVNKKQNYLMNIKTLKQNKLSMFFRVL